MRKEVVSAIENISIYPIISLIIFTVFFALMLIYVFTMSKARVKELEEIPLEKDVESNQKLFDSSQPFDSRS